MSKNGQITAKEKKLIRSIVKHLPLKKRHAIRLRYWECQTIEEIAIRLNMDWAQVNHILDEAIKELREKYINSTKEACRQ